VDESYPPTGLRFNRCFVPVAGYALFMMSFAGEKFTAPDTEYLYQVHKGPVEVLVETLEKCMK